MNWLTLTSTEGHPILVNMANVVSVVPHDDEHGTRSKLFSLAPNPIGDTAYTQSIMVTETVDEIATKVASR